MDGFECAGYYFYSNFDSGNLHYVESIPVCEAINSSNCTGKLDIPNAEFNLQSKRDCAGTKFQSNYRSWFYFAVRTSVPSQLVKFNIELNKQETLFSQGMSPVYRFLPSRPCWDRVPDKVSYTSANERFIISFKLKFPENIENVVYFAFTYPYSYSDLQHQLDSADRNFMNSELSSRDDIYYMRECVCKTLEGREMDLITVTSFHNLVNKREVRLKNLFPDQNVPRPYRFRRKKIIFVSARVHPGETPSSYALNGLLNLLLDRTDSVAVQLRRNYVFKFLPCLNPDGVVNGHFRTDSKGVDLNRMYLNADFKEHPTIYAARSLIRYYHYGYEKEESDWEKALNFDHLNNVSKLSDKSNFMYYWCNKCNLNFVMNKDDENPPKRNGVAVPCNACGCPLDIIDNRLMQGDKGDTEDKMSGIFLYVDMHAHTSKKGIFMYGNYFEDVDDSTECMLLPKIMSLNDHNFHFSSCNFSERNMYLKGRRDGLSKEGSGRVAVYKLTGLVQSYTLECNYNTGQFVNSLPPKIKETLTKNPPLFMPSKYTPQIYEDVGKALGYSILDLSNDNPVTRIPLSEYHTLYGLREWLRAHCLDHNDVGNINGRHPKPSLNSA